MATKLPHYPTMAEQLKKRICHTCFCFKGERMEIDKWTKSPVRVPICSSTQLPLIGVCTLGRTKDKIHAVSKPSRQIDPDRKKKNNSEWFRKHQLSLPFLKKSVK